MPPQPQRPRALQWQVFRGTDAVQRGLLSAHQLRSSAWMRLRHNVYADARLEQDHGLACQAAALWLPPDAAIAGHSAAYLYGVDHAAHFTDAVHVIAPPHRRVEPQQGLRVHHHPIKPDEVVKIGGTARTTPPRTAWDVANWTDLVGAVTIIDGLLRLRLVGAADLAELAAARAGRRGARRAARAFGLADGRAESAPESRLRVRLIQAGLPQSVPQCPVTLPGSASYRLDLAWPEFQVAVEYDGTWHASAEQLHRDRRRLNRLLSAGWIVLHVTSQRLKHDFPGVVAEIRAALRARGCRC